MPGRDAKAGRIFECSHRRWAEQAPLLQSCGQCAIENLADLLAAKDADDLINLRGIKMYPVEIEEAVRAVSGLGDEYEIVIAASDGLDRMTIRIEHGDPAIASHVAEAVRVRCEVRVDIEVLAPGSLPRTEFKAKRVRDLRQKN